MKVVNSFRIGICLIAIAILTSFTLPDALSQSKKQWKESEEKSDQICALIHLSISTMASRETDPTCSYDQKSQSIFVLFSSTKKDASPEQIKNIFGKSIPTIKLYNLPIKKIVIHTEKDFKKMARLLMIDMSDLAITNSADHSYTVIKPYIKDCTESSALADHAPPKCKAFNG